MKKTVRIISLFLFAVMIVGTAPATVSSDVAFPFSDVAEGDWFYESVGEVYESGLMIGTAKNVFSPDKTLDRAMFVTILGRLAGIEGGGVSPFTDVENPSWYSSSVAWAYGAGIIEGYPDGTFRPNEAITREQAAAMISRFIDATGLRTVKSGGIFDLSDEDEVSDWAADAVDAAEKIGLFAGDENGNLNPQKEASRAEAAAIFARLKRATDSAWQGYLPEPGEDPVVFGAKYLFENGSILAGGMKRGLVSDGEYPLLTLEMDAVSAFSTYVFPNETGVSINYGEIDVDAFPVVKICYSFDGMDEVVPTAFYNVNKTRTETAGFREELTVTPGENESGMKTATVDLTATLSSHTVDYKTQIANLLFSPCAEDYDGSGKFTVRYIGFFASRDDADAFGAGSDPEISDYLKNYAIGFSADIREYTAKDKEYYDKLLVDRIAEIKNSQSELTPGMIEARGGRCWYVSSIRGDDKNDGLSPETPFKTPGALIKRWFDSSDGPAPVHKTKAGDGVFFERGSVFYANTYHNNSMSVLNCQSGVDYGAYGEGPKPLFACALDFSEYGGVGNWEETGYDNVWKIECIDDHVTEQYDAEAGESFDAVWYGARSEIGNMFFDGGRAVGLRIVARGGRQTLGEGISSYERGLYFNGLEYYYSEKRSLENPGTALLHNLEYFHDYETGSLYLYWDQGNPADSFGDIKASRYGTCAFVGENTTLDNLAFVYSGRHCVSAGSTNVTFRNCEIGCAGGNLGSAESGIEIFGPSENVLIENCYIHEVYDGALSSQNTNSIDGPTNIINNVRYLNNVMLACGNSAEIWNHLSGLDENGVSSSKITNCLVKGNIMAYNGYGPRIKQDTADFHGGETICGSMYGEFANSRIEDNIFLYGVGELYYAYMATYLQPRGWESYGNTYVYDPEIYLAGFSYETMNYLNHGMWKRVRIAFPFTDEGLNWYTSLGIDPAGVYYKYTSPDPYNSLSRDGFFFMDGYYAERGENPSIDARLP